jgi:cell division protein FtsQ
MWSKVKYLLTAVTALLLAILLIIGYNYLKDPAHLPIKTVKVDGKLKYLQREQLQALIEPHVNQSFFGVDVKSIQADLSEQPWMAFSSVRRVWPDMVMVQVEEHQPYAYWGDDGLISQDLVFFKPEKIPDLNLPHLSGPEDQQTSVLAMFNTMNKMLEGKDLQIVALRLNARRSWQADLNNGIHIELGSIEVVERFERFLDSYPHSLSANPDKIGYVDLRYTNGFVIAHASRGEIKEQPDG